MFTTALVLFRVQAPIDGPIPRKSAKGILQTNETERDATVGVVDQDYS